MTDKMSAHILVSGTVQGVCYRAWTREEAVALSLVGWVRNRRNGQVEAILSGPREHVGTVVDKMHRGPERAVVTRVEVSYGIDWEPGESFEIRETY